MGGSRYEKGDSFLYKGTSLTKVIVFILFLAVTMCVLLKCNNIVK